MCVVVVVVVVVIGDTVGDVVGDLSTLFVSGWYLFLINDQNYSQKSWIL